jgi:hypothetical protein
VCGLACGTALLVCAAQVVGMDKGAPQRGGLTGKPAPIENPKPRPSTPPAGDGGIAGAPTNDDCADAISVGVPSVNPGTTVNATFDAGLTNCAAVSDNLGVWYEVTGTGAAFRASTCPGLGGNTAYDSQISVYEGNCHTLVCVTGNDDDCVAGPSVASTVQWCTEPGVRYLVYVHGFGSDTGAFVLRLDTLGSSRANDTCFSARSIGIPSVTDGETVCATEDREPFECGSNAPGFFGVWYRVIGNGRILRASTCPADGGNASYDSQISVYCGGCFGLTCIAGNDDTCGLRSRVQWCSAPGQPYLILVHGFFESRGSFRLAVATGPVCLTAEPCQQACCFVAGEACRDAVPFQCLQAGGIPLGPGSACDDPFDDCPNLHLPCCYPDGSCLDILVQACVATCGVPGGYFGSTCETIKCEQPLAGDIDLDGDVDVFDLLVLLNSWGPCVWDGDFCEDNPCAADLNTSGQIDIEDLLIMLNVWQ